MQLPKHIAGMRWFRPECRLNDFPPLFTRKKMRLYLYSKIKEVHVVSSSEYNLIVFVMIAVCMCYVIELCMMGHDGPWRARTDHDGWLFEGVDLLLYPLAYSFSKWLLLNWHNSPHKLSTSGKLSLMNWLTMRIFKSRCSIILHC